MTHLPLPHASSSAFGSNHERNWPGTHDRFHGRAAVYDSGGECGVVYERRMAMPIPGPDKPW